MHVASDAVDELLVMASTVIAPAVFAAAVHHRRKRERRYYQRTIRFATPRERIPVTCIHGTMGQRIFRRAFRMTLDSFWRLYSILLPHIQTAMDRKRDDYGQVDIIVVD